MKRHEFTDEQGRPAPAGPEHGAGAGRPRRTTNEPMDWISPPAPGVTCPNALALANGTTTPQFQRKVAALARSSKPAGKLDKAGTRLAMRAWTAAARRPRAGAATKSRHTRRTRQHALSRSQGGLDEIHVALTGELAPRSTAGQPRTTPAERHGQATRRRQAAQARARHAHLPATAAAARLRDGRAQNCAGDPHKAMTGEADRWLVDRWA